MRTFDEASDGVRLAVRAKLAADPSQGHSIAVNGVCLTAVGMRGDLFGADVLDETLRRSSFFERESGSTATLELALRANRRLGDHIMQDHVDGGAVVHSFSLDGSSGVVEFDADPSLLRYVVETGSIVIDGISLVVARSATTTSPYRSSLRPLSARRSGPRMSDAA